MIFNALFSKFRSFPAKKTPRAKRRISHQIFGTIVGLLFTYSFGFSVLQRCRSRSRRWTGWVLMEGCPDLLSRLVLPSTWMVRHYTKLLLPYLLLKSEIFNFLLDTSSLSGKKFWHSNSNRSLLFSTHKKWGPWKLAERNRSYFSLFVFCQELYLIEVRCWPILFVQVFLLSIAIKTNPNKSFSKIDHR